MNRVQAESGREAAKRSAGEKAASMVESGMRLGLGTGSTAAIALEEIGRRIREENLRVTGVPTSSSSERLARTNGIPIVSLDEVDALDLAIDGADEVDPHLNLIKGRGGAHTREKVVASLAERFLVLVDESKIVDRLGTSMPVPVEILPVAATPVLRSLRDLGAEPEIRMGLKKDGPVVTDQGFWIIDARFSGIDEPDALSRRIKQLPGVLDHGLFIGMATHVFVGESGGRVRVLSAYG